jgi:predicted  nucleic acid-binding Zn-ribbon protein
MMSITRSLSFACLVCLISFLAIPTRILGQAQKPAESAQADRDQTLRQLLAEVHELRLAVQRATLFQTLIERIRVQQGHVDALTRQLETIHSQIADLKAAKPQMEQQVKDAEELLDRTTEPNEHADLESRIKAVKGNLARLTSEDERLRNSEAALENDFQAAQSRLNELNSQLDTLISNLKGP